MAKKIATLISGGIDSAVSAYLLKQKGFEVVGVFLVLMHLDQPQQLEQRRLQAEKVCHFLGIPFHFLTCSEHFQENVFDPFMEAYAHGQTPNPCVRCNQTIKFGLGMNFVLDTLDASHMATGHYVRMDHDDRGHFLRKGRDPVKDQSYVLYTLNQQQLSRLCFPAGEYLKDEIRSIASQVLPELKFEGESVDLCFISSDYHSLISDNEGDIVDLQGKILGRHKGIHRYTIGQRQGLGIAAPHPLYVVELRAEKNQVVVGEKCAVYHQGLWGSDVHSMIPGELERKTRAKAKIRYASPEQDCISEYVGHHLKITFDSPQFAITKGQSVVLYDDDRLLGGAVISSTDAGASSKTDQ